MSSEGVCVGRRRAGGVEGAVPPPGPCRGQSLWSGWCLKPSPWEMLCPDLGVGGPYLASLLIATEDQATSPKAPGEDRSSQA